MHKYMKLLLVLGVLCLTVMLCEGSTDAPLVFVYNPFDTCPNAPPEYVAMVIKQAALMHKSVNEIILISPCSKFEALKSIPSFRNIQPTEIISKKTSTLVRDQAMLKKANWKNTISRFFLLEDLLTSRGYSHALLVDCSQMLYGNFMQDISQYPEKLIMSPLSEFGLSTSVVWVGSIPELSRFTEYYLRMLEDGGIIRFSYFAWLSLNPMCRSFVLAKTLNDRTFSSWYYHTYVNRIHLFPTMAKMDSVIKRRPWREYSPGGRLVVPPVLLPSPHMLVDPNSWGLWFGSGLDTAEASPGNSLELMAYYDATKAQRKEVLTLSDEDVKVKLDLNHFVGEVLKTKSCQIEMKCNAETGYSSSCFTAPFVRCAEDIYDLQNTHWSMLWNLRVRDVKKLGKFRGQYLSKPCQCEEYSPK